MSQRQRKRHVYRCYYTLWWYGGIVLVMRSYDRPTRKKK